VWQVWLVRNCTPGAKRNLKTENGVKKITELFGKGNIRNGLALLIITGCFIFLFMLFKKEIPAGNKDVVNIAMGFVFGLLGAVGGYYFGSSKQNEVK
jgi:hypothetical protein